MQRQAGIVPLITNVHGWGVHALYLAKQMLVRGIQPVPLWHEIPQLHLPGSELMKLQAIFDSFRRFRTAFLTATPRRGPTFHAGGNTPAQILKEIKITPEAQDVSCMVFEDTGIDKEDIEYLRRFGGVLSVSAWNADYLNSLGLTVPVLRLGVDTDLFKPQARSERFGHGKFVVFSGGKAELRKGQDVVLAAFKEFAEHHSDVMLVTCWHNLWPQTAATLAYSPHGAGAPTATSDGARLNIRKWASDFGLNMGQFVDLGLVSNRALAGLLNGVDVALFPNRCEGGTNMLAMECLAAGVPCILSANTGHLDLIDSFHTTPLKVNREVHFTLPGWRDVSHWREPDLDEVVASLELAYQHRANQREDGQYNVTVAAKDWGWPAAMNAQIDYMGKAAHWDQMAA